MNRFVAIFCILIHTLVLSGQRVEKKLALKISDVRNKKSIPYSNSYSRYSEKDILNAISYLTPLLNDTNVNVRLFCLQELAQMTRTSNSKEVIHGMISFYIRAISDRNGGISGIAINHLTGYSADDFSDAHKDSLCKRVFYSGFHKDRLIKLAGYLDLQECRSELQAAAADTRNLSVMWAAHLALARMGDEFEIQYCLSVAKKYGINDATVNSLVSDLVYIRQPPVFLFLIDEIQKNEKKCFPANGGGNEPISCGYRLMEYLARYIVGFPFSVDASGDIVAIDYVSALKVSRQWLSDNRTNIQLNRNIY
mgnify:CR=1 FL=1